MLVLLAGSLAALFALHVLSLSVAALWHGGPPAPARAPSARLVVLVPAHDEEALIGRCVRSLLAGSYPAALREVVVVADNCTDATAAAAAAAGARAMVRDEPGARGKGRALRWAMDRLLAASPPPDAIVVVDADTVADPEFLATLSVLFEAGARVVQGESLLAEDGTAPTALRVAAFMLFNRVRPAGREVLGRSGFLAGNGMLLARDVLAARPWAAYTSAEDLEYALGLHLAGVRIAFARGATLVSPAAPDAAAAAQQQLRWEGGKAHLARSWVPRLLRAAVAERRPALAVTALELALPPLGFLCGGALAGLVAAAVLAALGVAAWWAALPWLVAVAAIPVAVLIGLRAGGAGPSAYRAMAHAPLFVLAKALRLRRVLAFRGETWVRTRRARSTS